MKSSIYDICFLVSILTIGLNSVLPAQADEMQGQSARALFDRYCQDCHGLQRDGKGALRPYLDKLRPI